MTLPGDQPNPWSREGQGLSENQPAQYPPPPSYPTYPAPQPNPLPGRYPPPMPYTPPPPRRRIRLWVVLSVLTAVVVGLAMWGVIADNRAHPTGSTSGSEAQPASSGDTKVVTATDKKSQLTVPVSWNDIPASFKIQEASIQLGDLRREQYIAVSTVNMTDFDDFTTFSDASLEAIKGAVEGAQVGAPNKLAVGGLNGVRYEISGKVNGIKAVFWYAMVEGTRGYYQVIGWTLQSTKTSAEPVILQVIDSFRELAAS